VREEGSYPRKKKAPIREGAYSQDAKKAGDKPEKTTTKRNTSLRLWGQEKWKESHEESVGLSLHKPQRRKEGDNVRER